MTQEEAPCSSDWQFVPHTTARSSSFRLGPFRPGVSLPGFLILLLLLSSACSRREPAAGRSQSVVSGATVPTASIEPGTTTAVRPPSPGDARPVDGTHAEKGDAGPAAPWTHACEAGLTPMIQSPKRKSKHAGELIEMERICAVVCKTKGDCQVGTCTGKGMIFSATSVDHVQFCTGTERRPSPQ
jgi:hypothetical protein